jgi:hypothetical protein
MQEIYYLKASRKEWSFPRDKKIPTDWDNFPLGERQDFASWKKYQIYWKSLKEGDIIIGQSVYSSGDPDKKTFTYLPRISAIAIVEKEEHFSKELGSDAVTLKKVIKLRPLFLTKKIIKELSKMEPFKPGFNRYTITKISNKEFNQIIDLVKIGNPDIKNELKDYYEFSIS